MMAKSSKRLVSLDIFRGITIAFMIIVNTPGSWEYVYSPLRHSEWHGCTPTDLVFPFFLFIVGVSTFYSLKKYGNEFNTGSVFRILRRMLLIFAVGLFLAVFPKFLRDYSTLRIPGVLQRIALAYGIGALICLSVKRNYLWIVVAVILSGYWGLLYFFGGSDPYGLESNLVGKVDLAVLGANHIYKGFGIPFDPEGLLSTLPAIATVIIGYYAGEITSKNSEGSKTVIRLILIGIALTGLGYLWGLFFPINKPLWTSSYVLYTAGLAMIFLSLIYLIADVFKIQKWGTFFLVFGTNAIFAYFLAGIWTRIMLNVKLSSGGVPVTLYTWIYEKIFSPLAGNLNGSLFFAIFQVMVVWALVLILYRKKIYIRL
jgi:predicted acyltransferase